MLLWNIFLAVVWASATGDFAPPNLLAGLALGFGVLWFSRRALNSTPYFRRARRSVELLLFFLKELVIANFRVAYDVITPSYHMRPAIVPIPLDVTTDAEITLLACMITLTPGTLSIDVSGDRSTLYIHAMYVDDEATVRRDIKNGFERRILEVLR